MYRNWLKTKLYIFIFLLQDNLLFRTNKTDSDGPRPEFCNLIILFYFF